MFKMNYQKFAINIKDQKGEFKTPFSCRCWWLTKGTPRNGFLFAVVPYFGAPPIVFML